MMVSFWVWFLPLEPGAGCLGLDLDSSTTQIVVIIPLANTRIDTASTRNHRVEQQLRASLHAKNNQATSFDSKETDRPRKGLLSNKSGLSLSLIHI